MISSLRLVRTFGLPLLAAASLLLCSCAATTTSQRDSLNILEVSVPAQKMMLYRQGELVRTYPVSTSKFGLGDEKGSYRTPPGKLEVAEKIGAGKPAGAVFKSRQWTGEVIRPNAPGRDPIVSRILWLKGLESQNQNAYSRCIYIHGTAAERDIGKPASYGCVRMKSKDVIDLHDRVGEGTRVFIVEKGLWRDADKAKAAVEPIAALPPVEPVAIALPLVPVDPPATKPVWHQVNIFRSGADLLEENGFETGYLEAEPAASASAREVEP